MVVVIVLDLISVLLSFLILHFIHSLKSSLKKLTKPMLAIFYSVGVLALTIVVLEITGYIKAGTSIGDIGLHLVILGFLLLMALSLNQLRVGQLKRDLREIKAINRMKTEFLARTSHELKTPLTPLLMQLQFLKKGDFGNMNKKQGESLVMIERNIKRLASLINDILYYSKSSAGKVKLAKKKINLEKLASEAIKTMQNKAKKKIVGISLNHEKLPLVECDPDKITEVFVNLIDNAIKFVGKNGKIQIETKKDGENALVSVQDNGIGIDKKNLPKLFYPFTQFAEVSTRKHGGTGIGLSISKSLVECHGGKMWAESEGKGTGTTVYFTLPIKANNKKS